VIANAELKMSAVEGSFLPVGKVFNRPEGLAGIDLQGGPQNGEMWQILTRQRSELAFRENFSTSEDGFAEDTVFRGVVGGM